MSDEKVAARRPGVCIPWDERLKELPPLNGDKELAKRTWEEIDELGYIFIWHCVLTW